MAFPPSISPVPSSSLQPRCRPPIATPKALGSLGALTCAHRPAWSAQPGPGVTWLGPRALGRLLVWPCCRQGQGAGGVGLWGLVFPFLLCLNFSGVTSGFLIPSQGRTGDPW